MSKPKFDLAIIPKEQEFCIASALFAAITRDFQRPEVQEGFKKWLAEREKKEES